MKLLKDNIEVWNILSDGVRPQILERPRDYIRMKVLATVLGRVWIIHDLIKDEINESSQRED